MVHVRHTIHAVLCCLLIAVVHGCGDSDKKEGKLEGSILRLATTTSTVGSGLMDLLIPVFEEKHGIRVEVKAKGTGAALLLARRGEADVVLVHSRIVEDRFVSKGYGVNRKDVMYNEFVLLGPAEDPAGIKGETDILAALIRISASESLFISRGDNSGTHNREMELWGLAGISPQEPWYRESGKGMRASLGTADAEQAYILSDMSTFLFNRGDLDLVVLASGDERLFNPYGVIAVNPLQVEDVNFEGAMVFIDFITSGEGQELIRGYGKERFGKPLFRPLKTGQ